MVEQKVRHAVMEVSSHALSLKRPRSPLRRGSLHESVALITRLSQGRGRYFRSQGMLFDRLIIPPHAVINIDDAHGSGSADLPRASLTSDAIRTQTFIRPALRSPGARTSRAGQTPDGTIRVESRSSTLPIIQWMAAIGAALAGGNPQRNHRAGSGILRPCAAASQRVA